MNRIEHRKKRAARIGARHHPLRRDFFSAPEDHARGSAILDENLRHFGVRANFRARLFCRFCDCRCKRPQSALRKRRASGGMRIGGRAKQQKRRGTGGPWPHRRAEDSPSGHNGAKQVRLEKFGNEIRGRHRPPSQEPHHFFFPEAADLAPDFQQFPQVFPGRLFDHRRSER
jgi:hypothetical protein